MGGRQSANAFADEPQPTHTHGRTTAQDGEQSIGVEIYQTSLSLSGSVRARRLARVCVPASVFSGTANTRGLTRIVRIKLWV